jgi:hypothetical protein
LRVIEGEWKGVGACGEFGSGGLVRGGLVVQVFSGDGHVAYLVLGLLEIEQDEIVVGESLRRQA